MGLDLGWTLRGFFKEGDELSRVGLDLGWTLRGFFKEGDELSRVGDNRIQDDSLR